MSAALSAEEATEVAAAFLSEYWRERIARAATVEELLAGFRDVYVRNLEAQPEGTVDIDALRAALERRLGSDRVEVRAEGSIARVDLGRISASSAKADFAALLEATKEVGSHATLQRIELDDPQPGEAYRAEASRSLRVRCRVPLENQLFFGEPPRGPRPAIEHGRLVDDSERLRLDLVSCALCKAEHAVFYNAKAHAQDRDDVPFACLGCSRFRCMAWGIPELSSYRIDLVDRLPPRLAREARRHKKRLEEWRSSPSSPLSPSLDGVGIALWATVVIPALLLLFAWRSDGFGDPVMHGARTLATIACALHAVAVASFTRSKALSPPGWIAYTFAAVFALMIPVLVAMWR